MNDRFVFVIVVAAVIVVACGGDGNGGSETPTAVPATNTAPLATETITPSPPTDTPLPPATATPQPCEEDLAFNVIDILGTDFGTGQSGAEVDPSLRAALLEAGDLPPGFISLFEGAYVLNSACGPVEAAFSAFLATAQLGATVIAAVYTVPEGVVIGDLEGEDLTGIGRSDVIEALGPLDASELGEGALGSHIAMDLSPLFEVAGSLIDTAIFEDLLGDTYAFVRGEHVLILLVLWPRGQDAPANALELAKIMNAKAAENLP